MVALSRDPEGWSAATQPVTPEAMRRTMADFASGVTIVTARSQGVAHAMTATAFCSVSLDPPLVLVCVAKTSRFHAAASRVDSWAVSLRSPELDVSELATRLGGGGHRRSAGYNTSGGREAVVDEFAVALRATVAPQRRR